MSYFLRGSDGDFRGFGAIPQPAYETCGISDSACVARNDVVENAYNLALLSEARQKQLAFCLTDPGYSAAQCHAQFDPGGIQDQTANAGEAVRTTAAPVVAAQAVQTFVSGGRVSFTSSRGSNALQVGDTWLISITGATPNSQVTVKAGSDTTSMGTTDASGNFSLAGTSQSGDIGSWNETWAVGGVSSGSFSFTVSAAPNTAVSQSAQVQAPTVQTSGNTAGASSSSTVIGGFDLSTIPTWGWLAAAGVAAFFMFGRGGR